MIAMNDEYISVISADEKAPSTEKFSLAYRDYMQTMYKTGKYQLTDAFISGDNTDTMDYTIAVPILENEIVVGSVFGSIYFKDIEDILRRHSQEGFDFYLFGAENTIMIEDNGDIYGKYFADLAHESTIFGSNVENIDATMKAGKSGGYWQ